VNGKARLVSDHYCDGLGDCLPACPTNAITFEEREAAAYDEDAVIERQKAMGVAPLGCGCPGEMAQTIRPQVAPLACGCPGEMAQAIQPQTAPSAAAVAPDRLTNWPVQIKLAPVQASYFDGADLWISADCAAYACGSFHEKFMKDKVTLIGCPKLDNVDYTEKLTAIAQGGARSITVVRMSVPCCTGIAHAAQQAANIAGIPFRMVIVSPDGNIS
jgi:ferredoxin